MGRKKSPTSQMNVAEKQETRLAQRLNELIVDSNALKDYLGISLQAINQYRIGTSRPSLENLCKIADYYGVTTDYLLGRTTIKTVNEDIATTAKTTGLSEDAIQKIIASEYSAEYSFLLANDHIENIAECIHLYKTHLFAMYLEDQKEEQDKKAAEEQGKLFINLHIGRSRNNAERRGYKADLIEYALRITQSIDADFQKKYGEEVNDNAINPAKAD